MMLAISLLTTLCTTGIAFYVRFLLALCKECAPRWTSRHKPPRPRFEEIRTNKQQPSQPRHSGAALQITEIPLNINFHELRKDRA
jgi:hypothetical protein